MSPTVGLAIIGDEVLLGEVADENLVWISRELFRVGASLRYSCVLPDDMPFLVEHLRWMSEQFDWVITTGGIGATHDDLTREAVAQVTGRALEENADALNLLVDRVGSPLPTKVRELAAIPAGAELVGNPVTAAPGFIVQNLIVLPGIPDLVRSMFASLAQKLAGEKVYRAELTSGFYESQIADLLVETQEMFPGTKIGSYPEMGNDEYRVRLVMRSRDRDELEKVQSYLKRRLEE